MTQANRITSVASKILRSKSPTAFRQAQFVYDGDGGRVRKTANTSDVAARASPVGGLIGGGDIATTYIGSLCEVDSDGAIRKHIFAGVNRVCTVNSKLSTVNFYHSDHLGSSNVITDSSGNQVGYTEFTPYGSTFRQTGSYDPKFKFTGKELDASTGLYFYGARYYDPQLGRFTTADTIVQAPYDPQSLNRYVYCRNNPINLVDPTGHKFKDWWGKIAGVVLGIVGTLLTGNMMVGFQIFNFFSSLQSTISSGSWGAFAGGMAGGLIGGFVGGALAGQVAGALGKSAFTFGGGFLIGATEMGIAGFGGSFGGALGGGASFGEAMKQGGIGFGIGAAVGGLVEGSYLSGMQKIAHGMDREAIGKAAKVERQLSLEVVKKPIPVVSKVVEGDPGMHWGIRINDNYNEFNGTWDFDYVHNAPNTIGMLAGKAVPGLAKLTNQAWTNFDIVARDTKYITNVFGNIQQNLGSHYYKLDSYTCHEWVNNRRSLLNDNFN